MGGVRVGWGGRGGDSSGTFCAALATRERRVEEKGVERREMEGVKRTERATTVLREIKQDNDNGLMPPLVVTCTSAAGEGSNLQKLCCLKPNPLLHS